MMDYFFNNAAWYLIFGETPPNKQTSYDDLKNAIKPKLTKRYVISFNPTTGVVVENNEDVVLEKLKIQLINLPMENVGLFLRQLVNVKNPLDFNRRLFEVELCFKEYERFRNAKKAGLNVGDFVCAFYSESRDSGKIQSNSAQQCCANHPNLNTGKTQNNSEILNKPYHPETAAFAEGVVRGLGLKPCRDRTIIAVIEDSGKFFVGTNGMMYDVGMCQRNEANHKINQGYHLCKNVCVQPEHAEVAAINKWKVEAVNKDPILHVFGAKSVCDDCHRYAKQNGIRRIAVYKDMAHLKTLLSKEY